MIISSCTLPDTFPNGFWRFIAPVLSVIVFSPVAYKLWEYRTTDREAQDNFAYYSQAIQLIASGDNHQMVVGINLLTRISERTSAYDEETKHVFIEVLKSRSSKDDSERLHDSYAQSIVKWLYQRYHEKGLDFYAPTARLFIENQTFDLTDEDCRKGLIWLLLLAGGGQAVSIHFDSSAINYRVPSYNVEMYKGEATLVNLLGPVKSQIMNSEEGSEAKNKFSELLKLLREEEVKIRRDLGLSLSEADKY